MLLHNSKGSFGDVYCKHKYKCCNYNRESVLADNLYVRCKGSSLLFNLTLSLPKASCSKLKGETGD